MREEGMAKIGSWVVETLRSREDEARVEALRSEVEAFCLQFPVPGI